METRTTELRVYQTVSVPLDPDRAFTLFTTRMTEFWPADHTIGTSPIAEVIIEPEVGGRWYERGIDGSECDWGRVAAWQPARSLILLWQLGSRWTYDPELITEVEINFVAEDGGTRVELQHRHLERYGDQADTMFATFDSPNGWLGTLTRFAELSR